MSLPVSVVIPTHNRSNILQKTLEALVDQDQDPTGFEIIVVDDGSTDDTQQVVAKIALRCDIKLLYVYQEKKGAGAARNKGLMRANSNIVLFIDDDIIAAPTLVAEHIRFHCLYPDVNIATLGQVLLAPGIRATPLNRGHAVNLWCSIEGEKEVGWRFFFTGNISLKGEFLLRNNLSFDESLPCFQDIEIGYRCSKKGLKILYNPIAIGYHFHDLTFRASITKGETYGRTAADLHHRYPELKTEFQDYLIFSWRNPPSRLMRDLLRPVFLNRVTVAGLMYLAHEAERYHRDVPAFLAHRLGNYYHRKAYEQRARELGRNSK